MLAFFVMVLAVFAYAVWLTFAYNAKREWAEYLEWVFVQHEIPIPYECRKLKSDIDALLVAPYPTLIMDKYGGARAMSLRVMAECPHLTRHYAAKLQRLSRGEGAVWEGF